MKDNVIYWEDGDISDLNDGGVIRIRSDFVERCTYDIR